MRTRGANRIAAAACAVSFLAWSVVAGADAPPVAVQHDGVASAYKSGVRLETERDFAGALAAFESIPALARNPLTRLHIASCKRNLGRLIEARSDLRSIRLDSNVDSATIDTAQSDLDDLEPTIPKLTVRVVPAGADANVTIDGATVAPASPVAVDPGKHVVVASIRDRSVFRRDVNLAEGASLEVDVDVRRIVDAAATNSAAGSTPPHPGRVGYDEHSSRHAIGVASVYLGGGLAVATAGAFLLGNRAASDVRDQREACGCTDVASEAAMTRWQTATIIGAGLTVAAVGLGVTLLVLGPGRERAAVAIDAGFGRVSATARF